MKSRHMFKSNNSGNKSNQKSSNRSATVSRHLDSLRVVVRRMKVNRSNSLDSLINQKLKGVQ